MRKTANSQMERVISRKRIFTQKQLIQFVVYDELMFSKMNPINLDKLYHCEFPEEFTMRIYDNYRTDMIVSVIKTDIGNYIIDSFVDDDSDDIFIHIKSSYPYQNKIKVNTDTICIEQKITDCPVRDISDWIGTRWSYDHSDWIKTEIDAKDIIDFIMDVLFDMEIRIEKFIELSKFFNESILCLDRFILKIDQHTFILIKTKYGRYLMNLINPDADLGYISIPKVSVSISNQNASWYFNAYLYDAHWRCVSDFHLYDDDIIVRWDGSYPSHNFNMGLDRNDIDIILSKSI